MRGLYPPQKALAAAFRFPSAAQALGTLGSIHPHINTMAALTASMVSCPTAPVAAKPFNGLSRSSLPCKAVPSFAQRTVSNGARTRQMLVWEPVNNKCAPFACSILAWPSLVLHP